ncbi:ubiquitin carboxyl-terminal hydrolase [Holotrichia oblita]|uniref:Ubiquitin carboxyl-terminal hydrolase n=1 Tax=Holotrichia oblita TaxID=644536 RepID=A0ACB9TXA7_HOLOL|nr:ubiquitin carboxyl-terminal hydrolase [Holotrichia oblita]
MAVKHKLVECRENDGLNLIIRALQSINIETGSPMTDLGRLCEGIVLKLGEVQIPTATDDYKKFMSDIEQIQEMFSKACSKEDLVIATLKALYSGISDPEKQPSPTMSIVLQLIESKKIPTAVQWILKFAYSDTLERALLTLCSWLSKWMYTPIWDLSFYTSCKENTESSQYYLHKFVNLFMALMEHFPGHPGLYDDLKTTLEQYQPEENYKQSLNCKSWLDMNNCMLTIRSSTGKVGASSVVSQECTVVQGSFGGRSLTVSRCDVCGSQSERADSFRELQLSFPSNCANESVQELLDYYLQPERLCGDNQYHCDTCERLTDGERVSRIVEMPRRLILTLKHFRYDPASQQRTKLLQRVKLDSYLVLDSVRYDLYAAVVHCGSSVDSGHYYTYARDETEWYKFNDYVVFRTQPEELWQNETN